MSLALLLLGGVLAVLGAALIPLPGPGVPVIAIGLACVLAGILLRRQGALHELAE